MNTIFVLVNRNRKLFFRDKGMLISALITPLPRSRNIGNTSRKTLHWSGVSSL